MRRVIRMSNAFVYEQPFEKVSRDLQIVIQDAASYDRNQQRLARAEELLVIILNNADRMNTTQYKVVFQNSYLRRIQAFLNEGNDAPAPGEKGEG